MSDDKTLLLIDDDNALRARLAKALTARGFAVQDAASLEAGLEAARATPPRYVVLDLRLGDGYGLSVLEPLLALRAEMRIVILTAYGNIASAVAGLKQGAVDYLAKPADADAVAAALLGSTTDAPLPPAPENPMSEKRVRWEHITRVFEQSGRNVSETARRLKMHRRTLQRILGKHAPHEGEGS